jgi:hypothetical protein
VARIRFFIDPSKSDEEIAAAILGMAAIHGIDLPEGDPALHQVRDEVAENTGEPPD